MTYSSQSPITITSRNCKQWSQIIFSTRKAPVPAALPKIYSKGLLCFAKKCLLVTVSLYERVAQSASEYESRVGVVTLERKWQTTQAQSVTRRNNTHFCATAVSKVWNVTSLRPMMTTSVKIKSDQIQFFAPAKRKRRLERFADHFATAEPPSNQNQSNAILHMSLPFHNEILSSYTWHRSFWPKCDVILSLICRRHLHFIIRFVPIVSWVIRGALKKNRQGSPLGAS